MVAMMAKPKPTKEEVLAAMQSLGDDVPDGAYWQAVHDILKLPYGDVFDYIADDPAYFGAMPC